MRILEKIKYKRDAQGRIMIMPKHEFKKEYGFSPDEFDAAIHTFFKDEPTMKPIMKKEDIETAEMQQWLARAHANTTEQAVSDANMSSM